MHRPPRRSGKLRVAQSIDEQGAALQVGCANLAVEEVVFKLLPPFPGQFTKEVALDSLFANCLVMVHRHIASTGGWCKPRPRRFMYRINMFAVLRCPGGKPRGMIA